MATLGQQLTTPESGCTRFDLAEGDGVATWWSWTTYSGAWNNTDTRTNTDGAWVKFNFTGTKLIIIGRASSGYGKARVIIDDKLYIMDCAIASVFYTAILVVENLSSGAHSVCIETVSTSTVALDAIDIETGGSYLPYSPNITLGSIAIGSFIPCEYVASSGSVGTFSNLGTATKALIPRLSSSTPNGSFYFICVGYDQLGRKKLIADRNIQNQISWNVLNTAGMCYRKKIDFGLGNAYELTLGLLSGGVSSTDKDNEWDKIIVESTIGGLITAGDNQIWNWSTRRSWMSTTGTVNTYRCQRGGATAGEFVNNSATYNVTTYVGHAAYSGFRPVLIIENLGSQKYLFQDGSDIKAYSNGAWSTIGQSPVTKEMFESSGMDSITSIGYSQIEMLTNSSPKVLKCFVNSIESAPDATLTFVPKNPQLILSSGDIRLLDIESIDGVTIVGGATATGVVRIITSVDSGSTWKAYNSGTEQWVTINTNDLSDVETNGMTIAGVNAVPSAKWMSLVGTSEYIRFGYYLEQAASTDTAYTDSLSITLDMLGQWYPSDIPDEALYEYPSSTKLRVYLYANGTYKINY